MGGPWHGRLGPMDSSSALPLRAALTSRETMPLKIVVIDDDPTGSQTVHGCPLLLRWQAPDLAAALRHPSPLMFVLANTRALAPAEARQRVEQIAAALAPLLAEAVEQGVCRHWLMVSRGDSTLRGHFPLEVEALANALGPFGATLLVPAFLEGGRTTVAGVHRLDGRPVHETAFARDRLFGFGSSYLPQWVEEKTGGRVAAAEVQRLDLELMEAAALAWEQGGGPGMDQLEARLAALGAGVVAVDAERPAQLVALGTAVRQLTLAGPPGASPWLFQSAASVLGALAALPPQPLGAPELAGLRRRGPAGALPGLVLVGSHVPLADAQLEGLLADPACVGVELPVAKVHRLLEGPLPDRLLPSLEAAWLEQLTEVLASGRTPVLHTSRGELVCRHAAERRALGQALAATMARLAAALAPQLGYLISKGGITSHVLLAEGLQLASVELQGQLLPGLSLVLTPPGSAVVGGEEEAAPLPILTFPGNLGQADTLHLAWQWMEGQLSPR
jgi:uncharacterized protein YgbK (DUF1537 family)